MPIMPSMKEAREIAESKKYKVIPLSAEIFSDITTPLQTLRILKNVSSHCFILESVEDSKKWGRYTFLGFEPKLEITCANGDLSIKNGANIKTETTNPGKFIREILEEYKSPKFDYLPPFTGGFVGYFSYDYAKYSEPVLKLDALDEEKFNDVDLMLFDKAIAFDNFRQKIVVIVNIKCPVNPDDFEIAYNKGIFELKQLINLITTGTLSKNKPSKITSDFRYLFTKEKFCEMVNKAKNYIREGDIFQVVLSNHIEADFEGSLLDTYRVLRTSNPSPYMFYLGGDDLEIAGASPETLVKLTDGRLYTFPLAGTRPRGRTDEEDIKLEEELLSDAKELSEHNMLVDLGRNDIGKISRFGSVNVEKYMSVERFSHVMHLGSTVSGEILGNKDALDAVNAVLPAGTLSGAPKIRAMQIINELETNKRGIYGGAIGYLDFTGNMDACIAIRIAFKKNGKVFVRSGAGIVADSVPEKEYEECINKAKAVMNALKQADGGIDNDITD
ncbi:MAG: anthranilate synthase component I [Oscillospiraceae bacterium]|nr:anthranilate synthase component I [Oscillospiraceae bacterium]